LRKGQEGLLDSQQMNEEAQMEFIGKEFSFSRQQELQQDGSVQLCPLTAQHFSCGFRSQRHHSVCSLFIQPAIYRFLLMSVETTWFASNSLIFGQCLCPFPNQFSKEPSSDRPLCLSSSQGSLSNDSCHSSHHFDFPWLRTSRPF
jgi:hypothetical protein